MALKYLWNGGNFAISFTTHEDDHDNDDGDDDDDDDNDDNDDDDDDTLSDVEWWWCDSVSGVSAQPPVIKLRSSGSFWHAGLAKPEPPSSSL